MQDNTDSLAIHLQFNNHCAFLQQKVILHLDGEGRKWVAGEKTVITEV